MTSLRSLTSALLAAALLALVGCGGGGDGNTPAAPVQVDSARTARATLGPAGGTVVATAADGRRYTLTVPPGALATDSEITATPVVSMGSAPLSAGLRGAVRFGPAGLRFAEPATLRIEGVSTTAAVGRLLTGFVRSNDGRSMQLQPPRVSSAELELTLHHFSDAGVSEATGEELASVPVDAEASPPEAMLDAYLRALATARTPQTQAAELIRLHDERVLPRVVLAEFPEQFTDADVLGTLELARTWLHLIALNFDQNLPEADLPGGLGPVMAALRARLGDVLSNRFDVARAACLAPAPVGKPQLSGLLRALALVATMQEFSAVTGEAPDVAGAMRRLNDCARIAFVPRELPVFVIGRPVSLDVQAQVIFVADPNARFDEGFAFEVSSDDATVATPTGLSDAQGRYTTVVTPRTAAPRFTVKACIVPTFSLEPSAMCASQDLGGGPTAVVLAGEVRFFVTPLGEPRVPLGSARIRLRAELDGSFTVLEAVGSTQRNITSTVSCAPFPADGTPRRDVRLSDSRSATITGGQQNPFLNAGKFIGFTLTGSMVQVADRLQLDCSVITETTTFTNAGQMQILEIERDSQGLPLAIVMGDSSHEGRLVRE